jgi:HEAT repeat protein
MQTIGFQILIALTILGPSIGCGTSKPTKGHQPNPDPKSREDNPCLTVGGDPAFNDVCQPKPNQLGKPDKRCPSPKYLDAHGNCHNPATERARSVCESWGRSWINGECTTQSSASAPANSSQKALCEQSGRVWNIDHCQDGAQPTSNINPQMSLYSSDLVKKVTFTENARSIISESDLSLIEGEYLDCGIEERLLPACHDTKFSLLDRDRTYIIVRDGDRSGVASVHHTLTRFPTSEGKSLYYLFKMEYVESTAKIHSYNFIMRPQTTPIHPDWDRISKDISEKLAMKTLSSEFSVQDQILSVLTEEMHLELVASISTMNGSDKNAFESQYKEQKSARGFYHWSKKILNSSLRNSPNIIAIFDAKIGEILLTTKDAYRDFILNVALEFAPALNDQSKLIATLRDVFFNSTDNELKNNLSLVYLLIVPSTTADEEILQQAKDYVIPVSSKINLLWLGYGLQVLEKFGAKFGTTADFVRLVSHDHPYVRRHLARAFKTFTDPIADTALLDLSIDRESYVRDEALASLRGRSIDVKDLDLNKMIHTEDQGVRSSLARALKHVIGSRVGEVLLRLNADSSAIVRHEAFSSLQDRNLNVTSLDVVSLIDRNNYSSRAGLAHALQYVQGQRVAEALMILNTDSTSLVREAALTSLQNRGMDVGDLDVVAMIDKGNYSSRYGLVQALTHVTGQKVAEALLKLSADPTSLVREEALKGLEGRNIDVGDLNIILIIDMSNHSSRFGLAQALKYIKGQKVPEALLRLNCDPTSIVRDAALTSLQNRDIDVGDLDVVSMINMGDHSSRFGLTQALKYVRGQRVAEALLKLSADPTSLVREEALKALEGRNLDVGDLNVVGMIDVNNHSSRFGLAQTLKHIRGKKVAEALLRLSADPTSIVRDEALKALQGRNMDAGDLNVVAMIDVNNYSSRFGLAKALKYVQGQRVAEALLMLNADPMAFVRDEAINSLQDRDLNIGDLDVISLIKPNDFGSKYGLARALKHIKGQKIAETLLKLSIDQTYPVRDEAFLSIQNRTLDLGDLDVVALIDPRNDESRFGLARVLRYFVGKNVDLALIVLSKDANSTVRNKALETISTRPRS